MNLKAEKKAVELLPTLLADKFNGVSTAINYCKLINAMVKRSQIVN